MFLLRMLRVKSDPLHTPSQQQITRHSHNLKRKKGAPPFSFTFPAHWNSWFLKFPVTSGRLHITALVLVSPNLRGNTECACSLQAKEEQKKPISKCNITMLDSKVQRKLSTYDFWKGSWPRSCKLHTAKTSWFSRISVFSRECKEIVLIQHPYLATCHLRHMTLGH